MSVNGALVCKFPNPNRDNALEEGVSNSQGRWLNMQIDDCTEPASTLLSVTYEVWKGCMSITCSVTVKRLFSVAYSKS